MRDTFCWVVPYFCVGMKFFSYLLWYWFFRKILSPCAASWCFSKYQPWNRSLGPSFQHLEPLEGIFWCCRLWLEVYANYACVCVGVFACMAWIYDIFWIREGNVDVEKIGRLVCQLQTNKEFDANRTVGFLQWIKNLCINYWLARPLSCIVIKQLFLSEFVRLSLWLSMLLRQSIFKIRNAISGTAGCWNPCAFEMTR